MVMVTLTETCIQHYDNLPKLYVCLTSACTLSVLQNNCVAYPDSENINPEIYFTETRFFSIKKYHCFKVRNVKLSDASFANITSKQHSLTFFLTLLHLQKISQTKS